MIKHKLPFILKPFWPVLYILLFFAFSSSQITQNSSEEAFAFLPLRTLNNLSTSESIELTEWILFKSFNMGIKKILELAEINAILASDNGINLQTCIYDSCVYALGSRLQVQRIVWGTVESTDFHTTILLFLGDVSEKRIINTVAKEVKGPIAGIHAHIPEILGRLYNIPAGKMGQSSPTQATIEVTPSVPALATIELKSEPTGAEVRINGKIMGTTPMSYDSLVPGLTEIIIDLNGYKQFSKKLSIAAGTYKKYIIKLIKKYGALTVLSTPSGASVAINQDTAGATPYHCDTIMPGTYNLGLILPKYLPYSSPVTVIRNQSDTVSVWLVSEAFADSINQVKKHKRKVSQRIILGTLAAGFSGIGLIYNYKVIESLDEEQSAYDKYNQPDLPASKYEEYIKDYRKIVKETDDLSKRRNTFYILGGVFAVGFALSIPF